MPIVSLPEQCFLFGSEWCKSSNAFDTRFCKDLFINTLCPVTHQRHYTVLSLRWQRERERERERECACTCVCKSASNSLTLCRSVVKNERGSHNVKSEYSRSMQGLQADS
jgi:hypothetical protein